MMEWKFGDPPNVAVFTHRKIVDRTSPIAYVSHDQSDGAWQFLPTDALDASNAALVSLKSIVEIDESVVALADLPLGWHAWRDSNELPWQRACMDI